VTVYKDGVLAATTSASDGTYTEGGIGFTFWFQNGGWDSYSARGYIETAPSIFFGAEQSDGGASWAGAQNSPGTGFEIGNTARLRVAIENSGLAITDQLFELEFAPKGSAPSCEAVSAGEFETVPVLASCGSSEVCMATSTHVINGAATTDHLRETEGAFTQGEIVADPSNQSDELDVLQNEYTELEYALMLTNNVADEAYCFRVTSDGVPFDSYDAIPELALQFDPSITALSLNNGFDIALFQGATTTIYATGTVTDLNGSMDLDIATSTIFRNGPSGVGETCVADNNNCYRSVAPQCSFTNCAGSSCEIVCTADMYYFAEPTDAGTYAGDSWTAYLEISDQGGATTSASSPSVDLLTTRALTVDSAIDYGTLGVNTDTGSYNATTTIQNIGNDAIDIAIEGTDLTDGGASSIPVSEQLFATSTFNYSACIFCSSLATTTTNIEVDLSKPTTTTPGVTDDVYWGISIPFGVAGTPHQGQNTFYAIGD
jgi:hypothetical protein